MKRILQDKDIKNIISYINDVFEYIENEYNNKLLDPRYYIDVLLLSSSAIKFGANKNLWEKIGYDICKYIKQQLETYGILNNIGMFSGFGYCCYAVNEYSKTTGNLQNFSNTLNTQLCNLLEEKTNIKETKNLKVNDYDCISGVSGVVYYYLNTLDKINESVIKGIKYLLFLAEDHTYNNINLINFHITYENQFDKEKLKFPQGNINFGLSHGIMGPLIALSKAYEKGINLKGLEKSIIKLFQLYEDYKIYCNNVPFWPSRLPLNEFINKDHQLKYYHPISSWCYGNISIARGMQIVANIMNWNEKEDLYYKDLIKIINYKHYFESPSLCHGFSSLLSIRMAIYKEKKEPSLLKKLDKNVEQIINISIENTKNFRRDKKGLEKHIEGVIDDLSILNGSIGIVLSLLCLLNIDNNYENLLMIN